MSPDRDPVNAWVRPMIRKDIESQRQFQNDPTHGWWNADEVYAMAAKAKIIGAEWNERIVGLTIYNLQTDGYADIYTLLVAPHLRRRKIGSNMIGFLEGQKNVHYEPTKFIGMRMAIPRTNETGKRFSEANGFHHIYTKHDTQNEEEQFIMMRAVK